GRFVSTEKPVIVLDKVSFPGKIRIHFCFIVYLNQTINVEVDEKMFNKYNIGDTVKNVAVVIN
ncbi:MAG: hypothetical protein ABIP51_11755, partial [Bacteroidia bacterium]